MSSGVEFEEDKFEYTPQANSGQILSNNQGIPDFNNTNHKGMIGWLIKKGIVKSENSAKAVLLVIVVINILITFYVISFII